MRRIVVLVVGLLVLGVLPAQAGEPDEVTTLYRGSAAPDVQQPAAPDVVRQRTCSDGARSRLELTELGQFFVPTGIQVRFEVHRSPVGHSWRITLVDDWFPLDPDRVVRRIRVARDSGDLAVQVRWDRVFELVRAKAVDMQTGQVCMVNAPRPT